MAKFASICCAALSVLLLAQITVSVDSPAGSPAPPLRSPSPTVDPPSTPPRNGRVSSPPPTDLAPNSSPTRSAAPPSSPLPSEPSGFKSKDGMSGAQKFGIAIGVMAVVGLAGFAGLVYKKRRDNIRRSRY